MSDILQFPVSALLGICFLLLTFLVGSYAGKNRIVRMLAGPGTGAAVMAAVALMMALEGIWAWPLHKSVPFILLALLLQLCLGLAILTRPLRRSNFRFLAIHLGMYIMVWGAFWGAPDVTKAQMILHVAEQSSETAEQSSETVTSSSEAITLDGHSLILPFQLSLDEFSIEYYSDGESPRQYTSKLIATDDKGNTETLHTSVNHPCRHKGYSIYQASFGSNYVVLELIRDPWLALVFLGMAIMAIGAAAMLAGCWKKKVLIPAVVILAAIFGIVTVTRISFGTLPPALRSLWFVPHLMVYMVAYSAMAISVLLALMDMVRCGNRGSGGNGGSKQSSLANLSDMLLRSSSVLLLFGMLCGCVWARQAWGDYWAWDPKECWAAVTWLLTLIYLHPSGKQRKLMRTTALLLAFMALQMTWYGVNYLPSAKASMHTYNSK